MCLDHYLLAEVNWRLWQPLAMTGLTYDGHEPCHFHNGLSGAVFYMLAGCVDMLHALIVGSVISGLISGHIVLLFSFVC